MGYAPYMGMCIYGVQAVYRHIHVYTGLYAYMGYAPVYRVYSVYGLCTGDIGYIRYTGYTLY